MSGKWELKCSFRASLQRWCSLLAFSLLAAPASQARPSPALHTHTPTPAAIPSLTKLPPGEGRGGEQTGGLVANPDLSPHLRSFTNFRAEISVRFTVRYLYSFCPHHSLHKLAAALQMGKRAKKCVMRGGSGSGSGSGSYDELPEEVKLRILGLVDVRDRIRLRRVAKEWDALLRDAHLWKGARRSPPPSSTRRPSSPPPNTSPSIQAHDHGGGRVHGLAAGAALELGAGWAGGGGGRRPRPRRHLPPPPPRTRAPLPRLTVRQRKEEPRPVHLHN